MQSFLSVVLTVCISTVYTGATLQSVSPAVPAMLWLFTVLTPSYNSTHRTHYTNHENKLAVECADSLCTTIVRNSDFVY